MKPEAALTARLSALALALLAGAILAVVLTVLVAGYLVRGLGSIFVNLALTMQSAILGALHWADGKLFSPSPDSPAGPN